MTPWSDVVAFSDVWQRTVASRSDQTFLVFEGPDGHVAEWTYAEFDTSIARVANTMRKNGVQRGSAVHMALTNSPAFIAAWIAAIRLGAWIVPSDPMAREQELTGHIERTRPTLGICSTARADVYRAAAQELARIEVDEADVDLVPFGTRELGDWPVVEPRDRAAVMFTSGTTGVPKGVEITQANYAFAGKVMAEAAGLEPCHRQIVVLPMFHANAQYYSFASTIWAGSEVALMHTFSASGFVDQVRRHRATHASLFAAPMRMILARGVTADTEPVQLTNCWYAQNITDEQHAELSRVLGCAPRQLYGMTETIPAVLTDVADDPVPSSMGFVSPGCEVDIHDVDGNPVAPGEVGEIVVGGDPGITLFAGYLDMPKITAESYRGRWFRTGDRARRDDTGRFFFDGRRSDVLKVAGENVSIVEVEAVLSAHPQVLESAVVGRPDDVRDEVPVAFVVPRDTSSPPSIEALHAWCEDHLSKAKRPREITLLDELPRTSVGKIRKFLLTSYTEEVQR